MGEWSISSPTGGNTASVNNGVVTVTENNTSTKHTYVVQYKDGNHCGEYTFYQEGSGGGGTCDPCRECLGNVYVKFKLKNNTSNSLTLYPSVKIKMWRTNPDEAECDFLGQFDYAEPKEGGSYRSLTIPAGGEATLTNLSYVEDSGIVKSCGEHWPCIGEEASFMNGQSIFETTVYPYAGGSISCTISPSIFNAGSQGDIREYQVTIQ